MNKFLKYFIYVLVFLCLFGITKVHADTTKIKLIDVKVGSKSESVDVGEITLKDNTVDSNISFNKENGHVSFVLTMQNNDDMKYKIVSIEDNNKISNMTIDYSYNQNYIEKDEKSIVIIRFEYKDKITDKDKVDLNNLSIKINFEKEDGTTSEVIMNPTTGDSILHYVMLLIVCICGLVLIFVKNKKKIGISILVLATILIPFAAMANEMFSISLKFSSISLVGKVTVPEPTPDPEPDPVITPDPEPDPTDYAIMISGYDFYGRISNKYGEFRKATLTEYNSVKDSLDAENVVSVEDSPKEIYLWDDGTDVLYYSDASTIYLNENSSYMFYDTDLHSIDLSGLDSSRVTNMSSMFAYSGNLQTLDASYLDTSNVTNMSSMFENCGNIETIYVSNEWDVGNADTNDMFYADYYLVGQNGTLYDDAYKNGDYAHIDGGTSNPGYLTLKGAEKDFSILKDEYGLSFGSYTTTDKEFRKATSQEYNLIKDELTDDNIVSLRGTKETYMWETDDAVLYYSDASVIYLNADSSYIFAYTYFITIDLTGLDSSRVTDMDGMFYNCDSLQVRDLSSFDTSNVSDMDEMFFECSELATIYVSNGWDASNADTDYMFYDDYYLVGQNGTMYDEYHIDGEYAHIDGGSSNPGYLTQSGVEKDFSFLNDGRSINTILDSINTEDKEFRKATSQEYNQVKNELTDNDKISVHGAKDTYVWATQDSVLYYSDASVIYLNQNAESMFSGLEFTTIDLSGLDSSKVTNMEYMFNECGHLVELDLSSFDTSSVTSISNMFNYAGNLVNVYVSDTWDVSNADNNDVFEQNYSIVGQNGTTYCSDYDCDDDWARVDGGPSNPGYFSIKGVEKDFSILLAGHDFEGKTNPLATTNKAFRKATSQEYNQVKNGLTDNDKISMSGAKDTYLWTTQDSVLYYSEASVIYLNPDSSFMFDNSDLKTIDLTGLNSSRVTTMEAMFAGSSYLEEIDLSGLDVSNVTNMDYMFESCQILHTIYVSDTWDIGNNSCWSMFYGTPNLIGQNGTMGYGYIDEYYAHIDGGPSNPGYFTDKTVGKNFSFLTDAYSFDNVLDSLNTYQKIFRKGTLQEYNQVKNGLTVDNVISIPGTKNTYVWATQDEVLFYSEANTIYLNEDSGSMFYDNDFIKIDLTGLDSSKVTDMSGMFSSSQYAEEINLSSFDTSNVTDIGGMFSSCPYLQTIYVSEDWDVSNASGTDVFYGSYSLIGQNGTIYDDTYSDGDYAHVDGGSSNPGYLSLPGHKPDVAILLDGYEFKLPLYAMDTTNKEFRKGTLQEYNLVKDSLTEDNVVSTHNSPYPVYMWETNAEVLYYSEASDIYLNENCGEMFEFQGFSIIDLSGLKTDRVSYAEYMFGNCSNVTKIYVSSEWSMYGLYDTVSMFYNVENIVGGQGTTYDENNIYSDYAHIDGGPSDPGYLTDIADKN